MEIRHFEISTKVSQNKFDQNICLNTYLSNHLFSIVIDRQTLMYDIIHNDRKNIIIFSKI